VRQLLGQRGDEGYCRPMRSGTACNVERWLRILAETKIGPNIRSRSSENRSTEAAASSDIYETDFGPFGLPVLNLSFSHKIKRRYPGSSAASNLLNATLIFGTLILDAPG